MEESSTHTRAAYTDVDGTVTAYNTIFEFLRFDAATRSCQSDAETFLAELRAAALQGVPRSETNARYYTWWKDRPVDEVAGIGERWADLQSGAPEKWRFLEPVATLLDGHSRTRRIVAVSASFEPALVWVRRRWPDLEMMCTSPRTENGRYTGEITEPLVGEAKARAVRSHASRHGVDLAASFAYGDHHSDLPFMSLAGDYLLVSSEGRPDSGSNSHILRPGLPSE